MNVDPKMVPVLCYENEKGERFIPEPENILDDPPEGFIFMQTQNPTSLHKSHLRLTIEDGVVIESTEIAVEDTGWSEDLVLAMVSWSFWRWVRGIRRYTLSDAILISANACERCMNVLGYRYGMKWGYKEGSEEWKESPASCLFCS